ncbi:hypothetical protein A2U01_0109149, partial [Trifolium medium]|nr:hypothetical protein [Trifolium medium]
KQGFGSRVKDTSTLLRSACAKLRLETADFGTTEGFGEEEAKQAQGQMKDATGADIASSK